jgi:hypothetical protein
MALWSLLLPKRPPETFEKKSKAQSGRLTGKAAVTTVAVYEYAKDLCGCW